jgi:class 3 adenylate cyclase
VPFDIDYVKSGDVWVAYGVMGEGPIDLVFSPPYISNLLVVSEWPPIAAALERVASFARLIMLDKRGTGLSDARTSTDTFEDAMDDIRAVQDAVSSKRASVCGCAEGGALSALFAATYPERTSSLILVDTYARRARAPDYPFGIPPEMQAQIIETFERDWGRRPIGVAATTPNLVGDERFRAFWLRAQRLGASRSAAASWARWTMQVDIRHVLPVIQVPTLVLHGSGARDVTVENGRYLAEHIPGARLVELSGDDSLFWTGRGDLVEEIEEFVTGARRVVEPDRVLATVLFTDIVGSTERAATLGDRRWHELLDEHDRALREELERHRGREVKFTGDGILATFDGPARAIRCALAMSAAARSLGIEIRAGLHSGECEVRGEDVGGMAVHIGARVATHAGPSEVLVSSTVKDLVIGSGIEFEDRGARALKGVPGEWRLFSVLP